MEEEDKLGRGIWNTVMETCEQSQSKAQGLMQKLERTGGCFRVEPYPGEHHYHHYFSVL